MSTQFFVEAAVLVFVFPLLDVIIQYGQQAVTTRLVLWSLSISGGLYLLAVVLAMLGEAEEE